MKLLQSLVVAFSMYSKLPMPRVEWDEENMKYAMCFFPLIGAVIGLSMYVMGRILFSISCSGLVRGAAFTLLPIMITGGIHMDGFMDTMDAISSWGDREKKLAILKDSHAGAFAILGMGCYLVWSVAIWSEVKVQTLGVLTGIFVVSRALSGLSVVCFPQARKQGLVRTFRDGAKERIVQVTMGIYLLCAGCFMIWQNQVLAFAAFAAAGGTFIYYKKMSTKQFGGITGDLAGYFLEVAELCMVTCVVIVGGVLWR